MRRIAFAFLSALFLGLLATAGACGVKGDPIPYVQVHPPEPEPQAKAVESDKAGSEKSGKAKGSP